MASCKDNWSRMTTCKKVTWALIAAYHIIIPILLLSSGEVGAFVWIVSFAGPVLIYLLTSYMYKRIVKPFTTPVTVHIGSPSPISTPPADVENQEKSDKSAAETDEPDEKHLTSESSKSSPTDPLVRANNAICGNWSKSEIVTTIIYVFVLINLFLAPGLVNLDITGTEEPLIYSVIGYNLFGSLVILLIVIFFVDITDYCGHAIQFYRLRRCASPRLRRDDTEDAEKHIELAGASPQATDTTATTSEVFAGQKASFWEVFTLTNDVRGLKIKALVIIVFYVLITSISLGTSYSTPSVIELDVFVEKLPECVDGYTITLVSDVHVGPLVGRTELVDLIALVNGLNSDIITLVGDIADGTPKQLKKFIEPYNDLVATDGIFAVPGNHEYLHGSDGPEWMATYAEMGIIPLMNTRQTLGATDECDGFELIGVDDFEGEPDFEAAMDGMDGAMVGVVLAHQPNQASDAMAREGSEGSIDVMLSGHTHGGQTWPLHMISWASNDNFAGLTNDDGLMAYVSLGAFGWGPRTRFGSSNNVDVITLRRGAAPEDITVNYTIVLAYFAIPFFVMVFVFCAVCFCGRAIATRQKKQ